MSQLEKRGRKGAPSLVEESKVRKGLSKKDQRDRTEIDVCKNCEELISKNTKALTCNFCHKWVCISCLEVPDELYDVLVQNPKSLLMVPCKDCSSQITSLQEMRDTLNEVKQNQCGAKKQLEDLNKKVGLINKDIQKNVREAVKKEVDIQLKSRLTQVEKNLVGKFESMKQELPSAEAVVREQIQAIVKEAYKEEHQKDVRKSNLMMFNVPEKNPRDPQERKEHDKNMAVKVLATITDMENIEDKIQRVIRMGREIRDDRDRPLQVVFTDPAIKFKFLQKANCLSEMEDDMVKKVRISNDRTPGERKRYKELKQEMDERMQKGEKYLRIRKGEIVTVPFEEQEVNKTIGKVVNQLPTEPRMLENIASENGPDISGNSDDVGLETKKKPQGLEGYTVIGPSGEDNDLGTNLGRGINQRV